MNDFFAACKQASDLGQAMYGMAPNNAELRVVGGCDLSPSEAALMEPKKKRMYFQATVYRPDCAPDQFFLFEESAIDAAMVAMKKSAISDDVPVFTIKVEKVKP